MARPEQEVGPVVSHCKTVSTWSVLLMTLGVPSVACAADTGDAVTIPATFDPSRV
jgi:hypothetical protein